MRAAKLLACILLVHALAYAGLARAERAGGGTAAVVTLPRR